MDQPAQGTCGAVICKRYKSADPTRQCALTGRVPGCLALVLREGTLDRDQEMISLGGGLAPPSSGDDTELYRRFTRTVL